jgi:hypothetical protein
MKTTPKAVSKLDPNRKLFTVTDLRTIPIGNGTHSYVKIKRVIEKMGIQPKGASQRGAALYDLDELAEAIIEYDKTGRTEQLANPDYQELKTQEMKERIDRLKQEKVRADLEIAELKSKLIDSDEVRQFLLMRAGVETSLLRRILMVNAPVDIPGLTIPKARKKCEDYFNSIQDLMAQTLLLWQSRNVDNGKSEIPESIQNIINKVNDAVSVETNKPNE